MGRAHLQKSTQLANPQPPLLCVCSQASLATSMTAAATEEHAQRAALAERTSATCKLVDETESINSPAGSGEMALRSSQRLISGLLGTSRLGASSFATGSTQFAQAFSTSHEGQEVAFGHLITGLLSTLML
jgi:hypothetical protein